jgi:hypothetical protein
MRRWIWIAVAVTVLLFAGLAVYAYHAWGSLFEFRTVVGSGTVVKQPRPISGVRQLEVDGDLEVFVTQGEGESLEVEAEDNVLPYVRSQVTDGRLTLSTKPGVSFPRTRPIRCYLTVRDLSEVKLSGSGSVQCAGLRTPRLGLYLTGSGRMACTTVAQDLAAACTGSGQITLISEADQTHLQVTGSGGIDGKVKARRVESSISGSGWISLAGVTETQSVAITGSGDYRGAALKSKTAEVSVGGSGGVAVNVTERLAATISGSGDVSYVGRPAVSQHIMGSGSVHSAQ